MKVSDAYSGSYCSVERWPVAPEEHVITGYGIEDSTFQENQGQRVIFIQFDKEELKYRVNKTNANTLVEVYGDDLSGWLGATVAIHRVQGQVRGKKAWIGNVIPVSAPKTAVAKGVKKTK